MTDAAPPVRVFLLDDHEVVRHGLAELLGADGGFTVVGEAATVAEALRRIPATNPNVAVLDARLPDGSGIDVCREIRSHHPDVHCLILTSYDDDAAVMAAVMAGASGYVLKEARAAGLLDSIRQVGAGRSLLDPAVTGRVLARLRASADEQNRGAPLNSRERVILAHITDGLTNRQIAEAMFIAEKTVANNISGLLAKLGVRSRTQAAVFGAQLRRPSGSQ